MQTVWEGLIQAIHLLLSGDPTIREVAGLTLFVSGSATLLSLLVGLPIATMLAFSRFRGRTFLMSLINVGMGMPPVIVGLVVALLLWRSGPLGALGLIYTPAAMILAQALLALPLIIGLSQAALEHLDPRLRLQLLGLGASSVQMVRTLLWEARLPILAAIMAGFGAAISEVGASMMVGGNIAHQTRVLTTAIVLETSRGNFATAMALGILLLLLAWGTIFVLTTLQHRAIPDTSPHTPTPIPPRARPSPPTPARPITTTTPCLRLENVRIEEAGRTLLDIAQLDIFDGQTLVVIGPNGAGKSTLLHLLAGIRRPTTGRLVWRGTPLPPRPSPDYRRRLAIVMQDPLLLDRSVADNVALGLQFRGLSRHECDERVHTWLARLGIAHLAARHARTLSGGEAQRVALARAFATEPDILLLDEPFSALDAPTRQALRSDLADLLRETGQTAVLITHERDEAAMLGDRIAVLLGGRVRQAGMPEEIFGHPCDEEVAAFVGVENIWQGVVVASQAGMSRVRVGRILLDVAAPLRPETHVRLGIRPESVVLWPADRAIPPSSARNTLHGTVVGVEPVGTALRRVFVACDDVLLVALLTHHSVETLHLRPGSPVQATIKATAIHVVAS
nr:ABC transporter permease [Ardenticatena sp.]